MTPKLPTLADMVHSWTYNVAAPVKSPWLQRHYEAAALDLRMTLRKTRRFMLDDQFTREVVRRASTTTAEKMLSVSDLANLPFESVFIEYSNDVRIQAQRDAGTMRLNPGPVYDRDRGVAGWLIERYRPGTPGHWKATYFSFEDEHGVITQDWVIGAAQYVVNVEGQDPYPRDMPGLAGMKDGLKEIIQGFPWGYAMEGVDETGETAIVFRATEELSRRGIGLPETRFFEPLMRWGMEATTEHKNKLVNLFGNSLYEGRGDLRFLISLLAMLNHVPTTYVHRPAKGHYRARLRNVPYLDNRLLTIHCGRRQIINVVDHAMKDALGARHNKRHEVRGFWRDVEYGKALRGCQHEPIERDGDYCLCGRCGHLLRWIDHHERGDATLGWVRHDYNVEV